MGKRKAKPVKIERGFVMDIVEIGKNGRKKPKKKVQMDMSFKLNPNGPGIVSCGMSSVGASACSSTDALIEPTIPIQTDIPPV